MSENVITKDPWQWPFSAYDLLYADPPWQYADKSANRGGAERHYSTMSDDQIAALPVMNLGRPDSVLYLWITPPKLDVGLRVMRAWGYTFKTFGFVWVKSNPSGKGLAIGMGHHTRANAEPCLLGVRGKGLRRVDASIRQTQVHPRGKHSAKPTEFRRDLERLYGPCSRLELFARGTTAGWDVWGDEVGAVA